MSRDHCIGIVSGKLQTQINVLSCSAIETSLQLQTGHTNDCARFLRTIVVRTYIHHQDTLKANQCLLPDRLAATTDCLVLPIVFSRLVEHCLNLEATI
jgi:hypothetical protein